MVILDTDHLTLLEWPEHPIAMRIRDRLDQLPREDVVTTIINFEEQMRGWLTAIGRAKTIKEQIDKYHQLKRMVELYCSISMVDFDELAAVEFQRLKKEKIRIGTMDLKIASIALSRKATLISRNLSDYLKVPNLKVEDWTKQEDHQP